MNSIPYFPTRGDVSELAAGPVGFAGVTFDSGLVFIRDSAGACVEVQIDNVWRDEALLSRFSPSDAFRLGLEWQGWRWRQDFDLVPKTEGASQA